MILREDESNWDARAVANETLDTLVAQVMGNGETIRWVAEVRTTEAAWQKEELTCQSRSLIDGATRTSLQNLTGLASTLCRGALPGPVRSFLHYCR